MDTYTVLEILKYILPSIVVLLTAWLMFRQYFKHLNETNKTEVDERLRERVLEGKIASNKDIMPMRLQAFERMLLYLERINISNLILRTNKIGAGAAEMQSILVKTVREEFEHNFSQQLYIPENSWKAIKKVRDETVKLIAATAQDLEENASAIDLNNKLLTVAGHMKKSLTDEAISILRQEFDQMF